MAATITKQTLHDGERNAIIHARIVGAGTGELTDGVLVDVSALSPVPTAVSVAKIKATTVGMSLALEWDADTDIPFLYVPVETDVEFDYRDIGNLQNNAGTGVTGDITVTTLGEAVGNDATITIWVKKQ